MQEQTISIGNIPLMNSLGTSIVNGIYRIVINQILQSPGIYYRSELDHNGISVYTGIIILDWGGRSELEIDRKARIWACLSRKQKISILALSSAMGSNLRKILENVCYPEIFLSFLNDKEKKKLGQKKMPFWSGNPVFSESLCKELQKKFFQQRCELGSIGRRNMNRRLTLDIPQNNTFLLLRDILAAVDHLIGMKFGMGRTASFWIRDIHPSHYGRICPIDTSEGINVGLIGSLSIHVKIGHWGFLESPFFEISEKSKRVRMHYLSPGRDEYYMVAAGNSLALNRGIQEEQVVPARYRQEFLTIAWEQVHLQSIFPFKYFSSGAFLVLFIEHNDANRALMSSNMQRQVVLLSWSEKCIVGTGLERQAAFDLGALAIAKHEGKIIYTDTDKIILSEIKVGDKVVGRHGNKGIISKNLPRQDMPYLQDGRPVDMVFNPLGVPSRMNVGQIFECSLGLAGSLLDRHYRIAPFDERYEQEASRKLVFSELYEASKQTANSWVFELEYPGKSRIIDGRTGDPFEQPVLIGKPYILKLIHQVDDKIHGRSSGHYALVTQQPLRGRAKQGGQRVGEMEVWALEGFGVAHILQEMLTYKSDHIRARQEVIGTTIIGGTIPNPKDAPESFQLLVRELRSLALELNHFLISEKNFQINRKEA
ncbi:hypothetical protein ACSBR2_000002 [Camellia fascicularis]